MEKLAKGAAELVDQIVNTDKFKLNDIITSIIRCANLLGYFDASGLIKYSDDDLNDIINDFIKYAISKNDLFTSVKDFCMQNDKIEYCWEK